MLRVAKFLWDLRIEPALLLSSPLPRALQTAEVVAKCLGLDVREERALGQGFNAAKLRALIERAKGEDMMIVGHEPDFSRAIEALTGGKVKLAKGGIARVDLDSGAENGRLIWLIPPKVAKL